MGLLNRLMPLIPLILSLSLSISFGQIVRDRKEKNIKNPFFNPKVGSEEIRKVVVLPIHSEGEGLKHAPRITDLLVAKLKTVQKYDILPARDLKDLVEKRGLDWTKIHHYPQALEIGKSLGVDGVIMGSQSEYGTMGERARFGLNLRMIRIPEGDTVWSMGCSAKGKPKEMQSIAMRSIESIVRTLIHRWQSDKATIAWGIKLQPPQASCGRRHITLNVPRYWETEIKEYIMSRSTSESGPYKVIKRLRQRRRASLSFKDRDVQADWTYFYRYQVLTKKGFTSPFSEAVEASLGVAPTAPTGLSATRGKTRDIRLTWEKNPDLEVAGYKIYRSQYPDRDYRLVASVKGRDKTHYVDKESRENPLTDAMQYFYRITAYYPSGKESQKSKAASTITKAVPSSPKGIKAKGGKGKIIISWETNPEADVTRYHIYRKIVFRFKKIGSTQGISYTDENLRDGKTYKYKITAVNEDGLESPFSQVVSAATAPK